MRIITEPTFGKCMFRIGYAVVELFFAALSILTLGCLVFDTQIRFELWALHTAARIERP